MAKASTSTAASSSKVSRSKKSSSKIERMGSSSATAQPRAMMARRVRCCIPRILRLSAANGFDQCGTDLIRVHVRSRPSILEVTLAGVDGGHRDAHRRAAVEVADAELMERRGLMQTGQPLLVVRTVDGDVLVVTLLELLHRLADHVHAAVLTHRLGGEVGMRARAIPVALHRLRIQRGADAEVLGYAVQQPAREPQLVGHF